MENLTIGEKIDEASLLGDLNYVTQKDWLPSKIELDTKSDFYKIKEFKVNDALVLVYKANYHNKRIANGYGVATILNDSILYNSKISLENEMGKYSITVNPRIQEIHYLDEDFEMTSNIISGVNQITEINSDLSK